MKVAEFLGEKVIYSKEAGFISTETDDSFLSVIFWHVETQELHDDLGEWIADAINQKLERERK